MRTTASILALALAMAPLSAQAAGVPESNDTITMMVGNWTSFVLNAQIAGQVLQKLGYTVQYTPADDAARYPAFENGDLAIAMETWATTQREAFEKSLATGKIADLGSLSAPAKEEWWYPLYMKEQCPGLPDWKALKEPACVKAFSTAETAPKGRYLSGPVDWGGYDPERVEALGLPYEVINAGTEASLFAELQSAYERKAPILLWVYTPHWVPAKFKGEWVQFPKYEPRCYSDPSWGINPDKAYDCAKPEGWIKKMAWADGEKKWPCAYQFIRAYDMDSKTLSDMVAQVDLHGKRAETVASDWIARNESTWKKWASCAQ